ncbi:MAG: radical SAM protein [Patescibacteria group bacterium]
MNFEREQFEHDGLKLDKNRVLTYSQLSCPFNCRYCFVEDMNYNQKRKVSYLSEKQFELIEHLPEEINLIMLGCDTEFFQSRANSLTILERLASVEKDLSVITKLPLAPEFIDNLKKVDEKLRAHKNFLTFSVSIPCLDSAKVWEPRVPDPQKRIQTLKYAHDSGIKTLLALRPLLPTLPDSEIEGIVKLTRGHVDGYYSGPLYLKELDEELVPTDLRKDLKIEKLQPHWMPEGNVFYKIEKEGQMDHLREVLHGSNDHLFDGAAEAIDFLKKHEEY